METHLVTKLGRLKLKCRRSSTSCAIGGFTHVVLWRLLFFVTPALNTWVFPVSPDLVHCNTVLYVQTNQRENVQPGRTLTAKDAWLSGKQT